MAISTTDKITENYYRRQAKRLGLELKKSRAKKWNINNQCGYMIIDSNINAVIWGADFDLDIARVSKLLADYEKKLMSNER